MPVDTESLSLSGKAPEPEWQGDEVLAMVTFGGESSGVNNPVGYAGFVHDGFDLVAWGHITGRHIAGRPYLAQPMAEHGPTRVLEAAQAAWSDIQSAWSGA